VTERRGTNSNRGHQSLAMANSNCKYDGRNESRIESSSTIHNLTVNCVSFIVYLTNRYAKYNLNPYMLSDVTYRLSESHIDSYHNFSRLGFVKESLGSAQMASRVSDPRSPPRRRGTEHCAFEFQRLHLMSFAFSSELQQHLHAFVSQLLWALQGRARGSARCAFSKL
jgi:hypothetical protein